MTYKSLEPKKPTLDCEECDLRRIGSYHGSDVYLCAFGKELKLLDESISYHRAHCNMLHTRPSRVWGEGDISAELIQIEQTEATREQRRMAQSLQEQLVF